MRNDRQERIRAPKPVGAAWHRLSILLGLSLAGVSALVVASATADAPHGREARLYRPQHRVAADLLPLAEGMMSNAGTATLDARSNSILLVGERQAVEQAIGILRDRDVGLRTIVVHYRLQDAERLRAAGGHIRWSVSAGGIRVGNIVGPNVKDGVALAAFEHWRESTAEQGGSLRLLEGASSRIEVGADLPYSTTGRRGIGTTFARVGSGFVADANILRQARGEDRVRLEIDPFHSDLRRDDSIGRTSATTMLVLSPGEIQVLGEIGDEAGAERREIARDSSVRDRRGDILMLVWVEVE